jgi:hypothetical protein
VAETRSDVIRCASCGGMNPAGADWCGQCLARFTAPEPPPPTPPPAVPVAATTLRPAPEPDVDADLLFDPDPFRLLQAVPDVPEPMPSDRIAVLPAEPADEERVVERGAFRATGDAITWTCTVCDEVNPLEAAVCSVCGSTFALTVRPREDDRPARDPNQTALISLFFPGAGHAYLGLWGQAIARGVMSVWVAATALVAALTKGPNSGALMVTFGLAALALWLVAAHDAFREARGEQAFVLLKGRRYLWLTIALLGVMFLTLMMGLVGANAPATTTSNVQGL